MGLGHSLSGTCSTSDFGLDRIRWYVSGLPQQIFHLLSVSTKLDGMKNACLAQALHPISVSAKSDGMSMACLAQAIHPFTVSAISDGMSMACLAQAIHPISVSAKSDGVTAQKRSNSIHPSKLSTKSDGAPHLRTWFCPCLVHSLPARHFQLRRILCNTEPKELVPQ